MVPSFEQGTMVLRYVKCFGLAAPDFEESEEVGLRDDDGRSVVTWVERDGRSVEQGRVVEEFHAVAVIEQLFRVRAFERCHVVDQSEHSDRARLDSEATLKPFRRTEGKLALVEHMLEAVDVELLAAGV